MNTLYASSSCRLSRKSQCLLRQFVQHLTDGLKMPESSVMTYQDLKVRLASLWPDAFRHPAWSFARHQVATRQPTGGERWPGLSKTAGLMWWHLMHFTIQEVLEISRAAVECSPGGQKKIRPRHLRMAISHDADLRTVLAGQVCVLFFAEATPETHYVRRIKSLPFPVRVSFVFDERDVVRCKGERSVPAGFHGPGWMYGGFQRRQLVAFLFFRRYDALHTEVHYGFHPKCRKMLQHMARQMAWDRGPFVITHMTSPRMRDFWQQLGFACENNLFVYRQI